VVEKFSPILGFSKQKVVQQQNRLQVLESELKKNTS
jgi:hypothetical protein